MLNIGLDDEGGSCDLVLGFNSGAFLGEVGEGAMEAWLAIDVLIDVGRTLFVRRRPLVGTVDVVLLLRV